MANLHTGDEEKEFFVWVDPSNWMVKHNLGLVGTFTGGPFQSGDDVPSKLPFVPNPVQHQQTFTPFHLGVISWYEKEYKLELYRHQNFANHPSRLHALYLLESKQDALRYRDTHKSHVESRILKRCVTNGPHRYSIHDSGWIEFLRGPHSIDAATFNDIAKAYWRGATIEGVQLSSMGKPISIASSPEVLFYGRVDFPDRSLDKDSCRDMGKFLKKLIRSSSKA